MAKKTRNTPHRPNLPKVQWVFIDPDDAAAMLENNIHNRPLNITRGKRYAEIMKAGDWVANGETIKIDRTGRILDGQHRLTGIIDAGIGVWILVVTGLDPTVFDTIDTGKPRSIAQFLAMNGASDATTVAGMSALLITYQANHSPYHSTTNNKGFDTPRPRIEIYLQNQSDIDAAVAYVKGQNIKTSGFKASTLVFLYYIMVELDYTNAQDFFAAYLGDITIDIPAAHMLRDQILNNALHATKQTELSPRAQMALFIKAWNYFRNSNTCPKVLNYKQAGKNKEKFPMAI